MSDLFHDVARSYYGVSPELFTLANIATNGAAPAGYALGCESDEPSQYANAEEAQDALRLSKYHPLAVALSHAAEALSANDLHDIAAHAHSNLEQYFRSVAEKKNDRDAGDLALKHRRWAQHHENVMSGVHPESSELPANSNLEAPPPKTKSTGGGYVSPGLPAPPKQPKSMPGQKSLFACSQPYALGDAGTTGTGSADDDPMVRRRGPSGVYPAQARPMSSFGTRITLAGDYPSKPDFTETGTGTKVKVPESKNCAKSGCSKSK